MRCGVFHRSIIVHFAAAILYGGTPALASEAAVSSPAPAPPALTTPVPLPPDSPAAEQKAPAPPSSVPARGDGKPQPVAEDKAPHVALLLPLESKVFGRHAEAVRNGFFAAAKAQGGMALPVRAYAAGDNPRETLETYVKALGAGARLVVGPITRSGVNEIVESAAILVPTLVLNVPEGRAAAPEEVYTLSLHIEAEARQVAQLAWQDGYRKALTVNGDTPLLKRIHHAFVEEFIRLGGTMVAERAYLPDSVSLGRIKQAADSGTADMAFLALDIGRARLARSYLGALPLYATSQVHPGSTGQLAGFDLAGIRFLDMPWLLQPDHPAVMVYPRAEHRVADDLDRFYALGIDAFRVAQALLAGKPIVALDGVTGRLTLGHDRHFDRALTAAQFTDGKLVVVVPRQ